MEETPSIVVYGDSLAWGIVPGSRQRLPRAQRWPGVLAQQLGTQARVIEECLNGRTTAFDEPNRPGRNGCEHLPVVLESHAPVALLLIALGSNDLLASVGADTAASAAGVRQLLDSARATPREPGMPEPQILLLAPPRISSPCGEMRARFDGVEQRAPSGLAVAYADVAKEYGCAFAHSNQWVQASRVDGVHLDPADHRQLASGLLPIIRAMLQHHPLAA